MVQNKFIYLDNAATSWPKPAAVDEAVISAIRDYGGNPGRSGHRMSLAAGRLIREARELTASLFNIPDPNRVIFTLNATEALNLALKGFLNPGDHVITTSLEHNSILRPLQVLSTQGVEVTRLSASLEKGLAAADVAAAVNSNTKLIILTHASNVTGTINPVQEIGELAAQRQICLLVDAAQTAGLFPIDVRRMNIGMLAFAGHKSLLGPQGVGGLYISEGLDLQPLKEGGTGSHSESPLQPLLLPDRYESGTPNTPGIAGLAAGIKYLLREGLVKLYHQESGLMERLQTGLLTIPGVSIYGPPLGVVKAPVISFNIQGLEASEVVAVLDQSFSIASRSGLHCAPEVCRSLGLLKVGTVRLSLGCFNTIKEIDFCLEAVSKIASAVSNGGMS